MQFIRFGNPVYWQLMWEMFAMQVKIQCSYLCAMLGKSWSKNLLGQDKNYADDMLAI